jgi:hypothetical protein
MLKQNLRAHARHEVPERQRPAIVGTGRAGVKAIAASQHRLQ